MLMVDKGWVSFLALLVGELGSELSAVSAGSVVTGIGGGGGGPSPSSPPSSLSFCSRHFVKFFCTNVALALLARDWGRVPPMLFRYSDGLIRQSSPLEENLGGMKGSTSCLLTAVAWSSVSASLTHSPPPGRDAPVRRPTLNCGEHVPVYQRIHLLREISLYPSNCSLVKLQGIEK